MIQVKENEYLITGSLSNNETWTDILFMKTDILGNIKWDITYDNNNAEDQGINVIQTNDGGYLLIGGGNSSRSIYCGVISATNKVNRVSLL